MTDFDPYEVLGIARDAGNRQIKSAYRRRAAATHPDKVRDAQASINDFRAVQEAYEILSNADRRARYDATGRTDISKVTPERVQAFIRGMMNSVVEAQHANGTTDDPTRENILSNILMSIRASRTQLQQNRVDTQRKIERATRLKERFKLKAADSDLVGGILQAEIKRLKVEMYNHDDAMELSEEAERVFRGYTYDVGGEVPGRAEGQFTQPGTVRITRTFLDDP